MLGRSSQYLPDPLPTADATPTATIATLTSQSRFPQGSEMHLVGMGGLTTFSGWPGGMGNGFGVMSDSDLWMGPDVSVDNGGSEVEWRDVESLLAHIVPSWE
jgi:hypothetical protein